MFHYIYQNQFITSDQELSSNEYPIGTTLIDYIQGKYVPLNAQQIEYEQNHPEASPEEVFEMHPLSQEIHIKTPYDEMQEYFDKEHNIVYINNEVHNCWDHQQIIYNAECAQACGDSEFVFLDRGKYFKGSTDGIISMMRQIGLYYYKIGIAMDLHYRYLQKHPDEIGSYDYTTGFPEILHFNLEEAYVTD